MIRVTLYHIRQNLSRSILQMSLPVLWYFGRRSTCAAKYRAWAKQRLHTHRFFLAPSVLSTQKCSVDLFVSVLCHSYTSPYPCFSAALRIENSEAKKARDTTELFQPFKLQMRRPNRYSGTIEAYPPSAYFRCRCSCPKTYRIRNYCRFI